MESTDITLFVAPYIVTPLDEQILAASGDFVIFTCEVDGFPSPAVSWFQISATDMTTQVSSTSELI